MGNDFTKGFPLQQAEGLLLPAGKNGIENGADKLFDFKRPNLPVSSRVHFPQMDQGRNSPGRGVNRVLYTKVRFKSVLYSFVGYIDFDHDPNGLLHVALWFF